MRWGHTSARAHANHNLRNNVQRVATKRGERCHHHFQCWFRQQCRGWHSEPNAISKPSTWTPRSAQRKYVHTNAVSTALRVPLHNAPTPLWWTQMISFMKQSWTHAKGGDTAGFGKANVRGYAGETASCSGHTAGRKGRCQNTLTTWSKSPHPGGRRNAKTRGEISEFSN